MFVLLHDSQLNIVPDFNLSCSPKSIFSPLLTQISPFVLPNLTKTLGWVGGFTNLEKLSHLNGQTGKALKEINKTQDGSFFNALGGCLSLWLGISFCSLFEILELVFDLLGNFINRVAQKAIGRANNPLWISLEKYMLHCSEFEDQLNGRTVIEYSGKIAPNR